MVAGTSLDNALIHVESVPVALVYIFTTEEERELNPHLHTLRAFYAKSKEKEEKFASGCIEEYDLEEIVPVVFKDYDGTTSAGFVPDAKVLVPSEKGQGIKKRDKYLTVRTVTGEEKRFPVTSLEVVNCRFRATAIMFMQEFTSTEGTLYPSIVTKVTSFTFIKIGMEDTTKQLNEEIQECDLYRYLDNSDESDSDGSEGFINFCFVRHVPSERSSSLLFFVRSEDLHPWKSTYPGTAVNTWTYNEM
jgi:hypothetical protein